jgi:hypothetical protein
MLNILIRTKIKVYLYKSYSVGTIYSEDVFKLFRLARCQINFLQQNFIILLQCDRNSEGITFFQKQY